MANHYSFFIKKTPRWIMKSWTWVKWLNSDDDISGRTWTQSLLNLRLTLYYSKFELSRNLDHVEQHNDAGEMMNDYSTMMFAMSFDRNFLHISRSLRAILFFTIRYSTVPSSLAQDFKSWSKSRREIQWQSCPRITILKACYKNVETKGEKL